MLLNITQFIFHASFFKLICANLGKLIRLCTLSTSQTFRAAKTSRSTTGVYSYTTPDLHVVASSIAKLLDDAFVWVVTADARSMVNLVCLFMKPYLLALL